jgi:hypothetical protein
MYILSINIVQYFVVSYVKDVHPIKSEYTFCRQLKLEKQHPEIENVHHKYKDIHPTIGNIYFADEYTLGKTDS